MASSNNQRQGALTSGWKTTVRVALATGATVATLIGTQVLALADQAYNTAQAAGSSAANTSSSVNTDINKGPVIVPADSTSEDSAQGNLDASPRYRQSYVSPSSNQPAPSTRSSRRR